MCLISTLYKTWTNAWICCGEAGADEQANQPTSDENHDFCLLHATKWTHHGSLQSFIEYRGGKKEASWRRKSHKKRRRENKRNERKEQTRAAAELKLLFAIIMPQIGWQLPGLLLKNKKMKEMCWSRSMQWFFSSRPSSCGVIKMSWLRLWIMRSVKRVGQLYGSPTALTSQYPAWDHYCKYVVQTPRMERRIFLEQIRPTVAPEPCEGDQSLM